MDSWRRRHLHRRFGRGRCNHGHLHAARLPTFLAGLVVSGHDWFLVITTADGPKTVFGGSWPVGARRARGVSTRSSGPYSIWGAGCAMSTGPVFDVWWRRLINGGGLFAYRFVITPMPKRYSYHARRGKGVICRRRSSAALTSSSCTGLPSWRSCMALRRKSWSAISGQSVADRQSFRGLVVGWILRSYLSRNM